MPVHERRPERPGAERQLEVQQRRDPEAGAERRQDRAAAGGGSRARPRARTARPRGSAGASGRGWRAPRRTRAAASTIARSARGAQARHRRAARASAPTSDSQRRSSERRCATSSERWSAWASAATAIAPHDGRQREADRGRDRHERAATPRRRIDEHAHARPPARRASADRRLIANAGEPSGREDDRSRASRARRRPGKPVGCIVPRIGRTVCASPVSQAPSPGSSVER